MPRKQSSQSTSDPSAPAAAGIASFETEFERLTAIVDRLEAGNVQLGDMLKLYEEGIGLAENLKQVLTEAELKVEKLAAMHEETENARAVASGFGDEDSGEDMDEEADEDVADDEEQDLLF